MKNHFVIAALAIGILAWPMASLPVWAEDGHDHQEAQGPAESGHHDKGEGHAHDDGDVHDDHGEETDDHDEHGHDFHEGKDEHDTHGHGDAHGEHEEGKARIAPDSATRMGVVIDTAKPAMVDSTVPLTGRITLNKNAQANVRARFPGIVRAVKVDLGEAVEKGQVLAVVEANESLRDYNVTAPISGVVLERNTNVGDVANGEPLFMVADLSNVWAKFHVFPRDADAVQPGQDVAIHTLDRNKTATGKIDMFFPTADEISQTQIAIVALSNPESIWKPGMTIEGDVTVAQASAKVAVKETALQKMEGQGDVVFVQEGDTYEARPVKAGRSGGGYVEITQGLKPDTPYVAEGSFIIKSDILKSTAAHSH